MSLSRARQTRYGALIPLIFILMACSNSPSAGAATPSASPALTTYVRASATASREPMATATSETPAASPTPQSYTIVEGDTLLGIAERFGISLEVLMAANPGVNANFLSVGQVIQVPAGEDGEGAVGLATPSAVPLEVGETNCYGSAAGELWCFASIENTEAARVDTILGRVELLDAGGALVVSQDATTLLNSFEGGQAMPLVAYWRQAPAGWTQARAQLYSAFVVADPETRYLETQLRGEETQIAEGGLSAHITGEIEASADAGVVWVLGVAYDAEGGVVGVRRWERKADETAFDFYVYSLGGAIDRLELLSEAAP
jgi:LysM repeat protein